MEMIRDRAVLVHWIRAAAVGTAPVFSCFMKFGIVEGIFRQQIENQKTRKCLKEVFRRGGQGILIPFHELRKITEPGNQLKAGFAAG